MMDWSMKWHFSRLLRSSVPVMCHIIHSDRRDVAYAPDDFTAALIVKSVNQHDQMLAALEAINKACQKTGGLDRVDLLAICATVRRESKDAIRKARCVFQ